MAGPPDHLMIYNGNQLLLLSFYGHWTFINEKYNPNSKAGCYWEFHVEVNWIAEYLCQKPLGNLK